MQIILLPLFLLEYGLVSDPRLFELGFKKTFDKKKFIFDKKILDKMTSYIELKDTILKNYDIIAQELRRRKKSIDETNSNPFDGIFVNKESIVELTLFHSLTSQIIAKIGYEQIIHIALYPNKTLIFLVKMDIDNSKNRYLLHHEFHHKLVYPINFKKIESMEDTDEILAEKDTIIYKDWIYELEVIRKDHYPN